MFKTRKCACQITVGLVRHGCITQLMSWQPFEHVLYCKTGHVGEEGKMQHCKHAAQVRLPDDANFSYQVLCYTVTENFSVCVCFCAYLLCGYYRNNLQLAYSMQGKTYSFIPYSEVAL